MSIDLQSAIRDLESKRQHIQRGYGKSHTHDGEESLTSRLVSILRAEGYDATAEADESGSVDILVRCDPVNIVWLGECKVFRSYGALEEGMLQLHTRYMSGRYPSTGFIIFCFNVDATSVLKQWKERIMEQRTCGLIGATAIENDLSFASTHRHVSSGCEVVTRHFIAALYWRPIDASGRRQQDA